MNLIIYNFRKDNAITNDLIAFNTLLFSVPDCKPASLVIRFGKSIERKLRPLKVIFHDRHDAMLVLTNTEFAKKNNFIIKNDQTLNQRLYFKSLRAELNTRISEGQEDLTIKYVDNIPTIVPKNV